MATIQHSIEVRMPAQSVFRQLSRFEDYPRFMEDVESVRQIDATHLHWTTRMANRPVEWDAEITEREEGRCIAWHNTSGPTNAGKVEVQPMGSNASHVTITLRAEPQQVPGSMDDYGEEQMAARLMEAMARMKSMMEAGGAQQPSHSSMRHLGELPQDTSPDTHASPVTSDSAGVAPGKPV